MQKDPNLLDQLIGLNDQLKDIRNRLTQQISNLERLLATSQQQQQQQQQIADLEQQAIDEAKAAAQKEIYRKQAVANFKPSGPQVPPPPRPKSSGSDSDSDWGKKYLKYKNKYQKLKNICD